MAHGSRLTAHGSRLTAHGHSCAQDTSDRPQFVVLGDPVGGFLPSAEAHGALLSRKITSKFIRKLFNIHNSWKLNHIVELPFKFIWDRYIFDNSSISDNRDIYFIFTDVFRLAYSRNYLRHLRKK